MTLTNVFARQLRRLREAAGFSQDALAHHAKLDRTYVGQLERGLKSPTLQTVEKLANVLSVSPTQLIRSLDVPAEADLPAAGRYRLADERDLRVARSTISASVVMGAVNIAHGLIDELYAYDLDIASILGLRNLSAFVGELVAGAVERVAGDQLRPNPHQDGYPDLLLMDDIGRREWERLERAGRLSDKSPFSPFAGGGIEVKATCGAIPTPKEAERRGIKRPMPGDERVGALTGYDWKAHHRETNHLLGVLWDFAAGRPRIAALFYSDELDAEDWSEIVQPREGGGKTTSVSIMRPSGIRKMYAGWICVIDDDRYANFLNRKNRGDLIPIASERTAARKARSRPTASHRRP